MWNTNLTTNVVHVKSNSGTVDNIAVVDNNVFTVHQKNSWIKLDVGIFKISASGTCMQSATATQQDSAQSNIVAVFKG